MPEFTEVVITLKQINKDLSKKFHLRLAKKELNGSDLETIKTFLKNNSVIFSLSIEGEIDSIGADCFHYFQNIDSISLPKSLHTIKSGAFSYCTSLTNMVVPISVKFIDKGAFRYCTSLEKIILPDEVLTLKSNTFLNCEKLKKVKLPKSLKIIETFTFRECTSLQSLKIPSNIEDVTFEAFHGCTQLNKIFFDNSFNKKIFHRHFSIFQYAMLKKNYSLALFLLTKIKNHSKKYLFQLAEEIFKKNPEEFSVNSYSNFLKECLKDQNLSKCLYFLKDRKVIEDILYQVKDLAFFNKISKFFDDSHTESNHINFLSVEEGNSSSSNMILENQMGIQQIASPYLSVLRKLSIDLRFSGSDLRSIFKKSKGHYIKKINHSIARDILEYLPLKKRALLFVITSQENI